MLVKGATAVCPNEIRAFETQPFGVLPLIYSWRCFNPSQMKAIHHIEIVGRQK